MKAELGPKWSIYFVIAIAILASFHTARAQGPVAPTNAPPASTSKQAYQGILIDAESVTPPTIESWKKQSLSVVLRLQGLSQDRDAQVAESQAAQLLKDAGFDVEYFIEIGRCPELADSHPEWMASLQGHAQWRRFWPDFAKPSATQVVKNYPWVPILYRETLEAHLVRLQRLLKDKPVPKRLWLNDLQGAPSACGCGHPLCRWTSDYGPIKTATPLGDEAAAEFLSRVGTMIPDTELIPILVSECEELDKEKECAGVGCFEGICWKALSKQLDAVQVQAPQIGVACFFKAFQRDLDRYGPTGAWTQFALESFSNMPPRRGGRPVPTSRLIAVVQGWNVTQAEIDAQVRSVQKANAAGWLIASCEIDQTWQPKLFEFDPAKVKAISQKAAAVGTHQNHSH